MGTIAIKGLGKAFLKRRSNLLKTKGDMEIDPAVRQGISMAKRDIKKKGYIGIKSQKIPKDLNSSELEEFQEEM